MLVILLTCRPLGTEECDESSMTDEYSYLEDSLDSSECSSVENYGEEEKMAGFFHDSDVLEERYFSALEFNSKTSFDILLKKPSQDESSSTMGSETRELSNNADLSGYAMGSESHELSNDADLPGYAMSLRSLKSCEVERANLNLGKSKLRERCIKVKLPSFDFESVKNPLTECVDRLDSFYRANSTDNTINYHNKGHVGDEVTVKKNSIHTHTSSGLKTNHQEQELLPNVSGGGSWESLLDGTGNKTDIHPAQPKTSVAAVIEIPLDFVLEKCLLEEIQLQYP